mmetsp:Transcript_50333/g.93028  ORF Transcript_50333/g.93028 Transcript_50333/m.93028 type:complete len:81 (-) Transcript_50333:528-770(-)
MDENFMFILDQGIEILPFDEGRNDFGFVDSVRTHNNSTTSSISWIATDMMPTVRTECSASFFRDFSPLSFLCGHTFSVPC